MTESRLGYIDRCPVSDMDFSFDDEVLVTVDLSDFRDVRISYTAIVQLYDGLFANHPGYPEKLYGGCGCWCHTDYQGKVDHYARDCDCVGKEVEVKE